MKFGVFYIDKNIFYNLFNRRQKEMSDFSSAKFWEQVFISNPKIKELAIKAGIENNPKRLNELRGAFAFNFGRDVCKSEVERELSMYLFCCDLPGEDTIEDAISGRITAAREAGESEL